MKLWKLVLLSLSLSSLGVISVVCLIVWMFQRLAEVPV